MRAGRWLRAWCGLAASVAAPERAAVEPYLLPPYGWWLRAQVSRSPPPPLPGGYKLGEKVFYTGESQTASTGEKWVHGQQGEVTGPATGEHTKGKGVAVRFPGNKGAIECYLTTVRRLPASSAATSTPACAPHTRRDAAHIPVTSLCFGTPALTACAAARAVAQRPAPECGVCRCGQVASEAAPERPGDASPPSFGCWTCAGEPQSAAGIA